MKIYGDYLLPTGFILARKDKLKHFIKDLLSEERERMIKIIEDAKYEGVDLSNECSNAVCETLNKVLTKLRDKK